VDEPLQEPFQAALGKKNSDLSDEERALMSEIADYQKMNEIRDRVSSIVSDPAPAEALKPWYGQWCKRPTFNDDYLPTFNRPNVKLVDTKGKGIERVTENAVVVDGVEYAVDCLIFATGFEVGTAYTRRAEFEVYGRGGLSLSDYWGEWDEDPLRLPEPRLSELLPYGSHPDRPRTELHLHAGRAGHSHRPCHHGGEAREGKSVEPTPEAEGEWVKRVTGPTFMSAYQDVCTPGYYNGEGKRERTGLLEASDPDGAVRFYEMLARWREQGDLEGLIVE